MASGIAFPSFLVLQGPAVNANHALRGAGVKAEARRGRATRGALTPVSTGLHFTAAGPSFNCQKPCIQSGEEPSIRSPTSASAAPTRRSNQVARLGGCVDFMVFSTKRLAVELAVSFVLGGAKQSAEQNADG